MSWSLSAPDMPVATVPCQPPGDEVRKKYTTVDKAYFSLDQLCTYILGRLQILRPGPGVGTAKHSNTFQVFSGGHAY